MKEIIYQPNAIKSLKKMPSKVVNRIVSKITAYAKDPATLANNTKSLKGTEAIRLRVGDWRVIMIDDQVITIVKIAPRGSAY